MESHVVLDRTKTADGDSLELAVEDGHHIIRIGGVPLMSSSMTGSEEAMAFYALEELGQVEAARILIGGLGMGFTLRATLDTFEDLAEVCVAELSPDIIRYNREFLANLTDHAMDDPRVEIYEGDVRRKFKEGGWDAILMDVDNGPDALSARSNRSLYGARGVEAMAIALAPGGVLVVWSAYPSPRFLEQLRHTGLSARAAMVRAHWPLSKGPMHTLFVGTNP